MKYDEEAEFNNILEQYLLGNFSQLDKTDLIKIARYFEEKCFAIVENRK